MASVAQASEYQGRNEMAKAVRVHKVGGPEALVYEDVDVSAPGAGAYLGR